MKDEFYIVLPSNSSMDYYPDNVTTRYTTHLPQCVSLHGSWAVSLAEIHIPATILHIPSNKERGIKNYATASDNVGVVKIMHDCESVPAGIYPNIDTLLAVINKISCFEDHLKLTYAPNGYVVVSRICESCGDVAHALNFSSQLNKILGLTEAVRLLPTQTEYTAQRPASLANGAPNMMYVYTDICEPYITGDVHAPLLRVVPTAIADSRNYGTVKIRSFSPPRYIPLLRNNFQTITIDIRDEFGVPIPFEYGTLTVTLQFKRTD